MNARSLHRRAIVSICFVLCLLALLDASACSSGPVVTVANKSRAALIDVTLFYAGGRTALRRMGVDETRSVSIQVQGESDLRLEFVDVRGMRHDEKVDVYIESGYRGNLTITVQPDFKVKWQGRIGP